MSIPDTPSRTAELNAMGMACRTLVAVSRTTNDAAAADKIAALLILAGGMERTTAAGIAAILAEPIRRGINVIAAES